MFNLSLLRCWKRKSKIEYVELKKNTNRTGKRKKETQTKSQNIKYIKIKIKKSTKKVLS